jgi:ATP-dependent DNA helicase PIF1
MAIELTEDFLGALDYLNSRSHLFLTGKAGTGKSTLVRHYIETTDRNVVVAAPTGIAALNVNGYTLHRLFSFSTVTTIEDVLGPNYYPGRFSKAIKAMDTLIIDEASMIRADLLDMVEAALRRFGPHPGQSFGGVQVVLVGDLLQLPPVVKESESMFFSTRYETPFFFSADAYDRNSFPTVVLTKVFRQLGDHRLTWILNAVREGVLVADAEKELHARLLPDFEPPDDEFWLTLAPTNTVAASRNNRELERLPAEGHSSTAIQRGDLSLFDLSSVEEVVQYKVGAQVMMLTNDPADRWVNGTIGRIVAVDDPTEQLITIAFRDGETAQVGLHTWDVTRPGVEGGALRHEVVGTFTQLPFKLAWAITIHKSQGQTLDNLIVDLTGGAFASGQVYVALSRCTSLNGLVLKRPIRPKDLRTDRRVLRFMREATSPATEARFCSIAVLGVGNTGRMWRPRPVEIAVAFDDGTALSTLINPSQDLFSARDDYDITVPDILLAPSLTEAWSVLGPVLQGWIPVGVDIDGTLADIDFELRRNDTTVAFPVGISIPGEALTAAESEGLTARTALGRAKAQLAALQRLRPEDLAAEPFDDHAVDGRVTFLLTRDPDAPTPQPAHMPIMAGLAQVSCELSAVILNGAIAAEVKHPSSEMDDIRTIMGRFLSVKAEGMLPFPSTIADHLAQVDELLGTSLEIANRDSITQTASVDETLLPGVTFYISGTPHTPSGDRIEKGEVAAMAAERGLVYVDSFGKKACGVLVVAEEGSQSGKARKAAGWGMPVFSLQEFWQWLGPCSREARAQTSAGQTEEPSEPRSIGPKFDVEILEGDEVLEVVGESHYQDALWQIVGGDRASRFRKPIQATLLPEPDNPYDSNAIGVWVAGRQVGYVGRDDASAMIAGLRSLMTIRRNVRIALNGVIAGRGAQGGESGALGVFLEYDPNDFRESGPSVLEVRSPAFPGNLPDVIPSAIGELAADDPAIRTGLSTAIWSDRDDDAYDLSWWDSLSEDKLKRLDRLRELAASEIAPISRHFIFAERIALLYRLRDELPETLTEFDGVAFAHHVELESGIRAALLAKFGGLPLVDTYRQACVRQVKAGNLEAALEWAQRGVDFYGNYALKQE